MGGVASLQSQCDKLSDTANGLATQGAALTSAQDSQSHMACMRAADGSVLHPGAGIPDISYAGGCKYLYQLWWCVRRRRCWNAFDCATLLPKLATAAPPRPLLPHFVMGWD
jgi:hypothetical protein